MSRNQLWKPVCGLLVLLSIPLTGRSDVVQDWNAIMQATVTSQAPFPQARFGAITQLAVFEAVNAITREYKPYLGTITAPVMRRLKLRLPRERRLEPARILSTHLSESRGLATNAQLPGCRWTFFQLAERYALRYPERQPVLAGCTSRPH